MEEIWKDIPGYEGKYQVSNLGRVKSLSKKLSCVRNGKTAFRVTKEKIMKPYIPKNGYARMDLGGRNTNLVHRLVAKAFIPNPENKPCVNHIDGNPSNNNLHNLEWCTYSENELHSYRKLGKISGKPQLGKRGKLNVTSNEVLMFDLSLNFKRSFESAILATEWLRSNGYPKASQGSVSNGCRGVYHHAYNHRWAYGSVAPRNK
jgi:hypothetical protein